MSGSAQLTGLCDRFRGLCPVVVDVETAGSNVETNALPEIAAITPKMSEQGWLMPDTILHFHVEPFVGANLQPGALVFNGIDPNGPDRDAVNEYGALHEVFKAVRRGIKAGDCDRAIVVVYNASSDHSFTMTTAGCISLKHNPFHPFATLDTVVLAGPAFEQAVLLKAYQTVGMDFDSIQAHSVLYDTGYTAVLFCEVVDRWECLGDWSLPVVEEV